MCSHWNAEMAIGWNAGKVKILRHRTVGTLRQRTAESLRTSTLAETFGANIYTTRTKWQWESHGHSNQLTGAIVSPTLATLTLLNWLHKGTSRVESTQKKMLGCTCLSVRSAWYYLQMFSTTKFAGRHKCLRAWESCQLEAMPYSLRRPGRADSFRCATK